MKRVLIAAAVALSFVACATTQSVRMSEPVMDSAADAGVPSDVVSMKGDTITFRGEVNQDSVAAAIAGIELANEAGAESIKIVLDSPGGSIGAGMRLAAAIEASAAPVTCLVDGEAASMGSYILQSCDVREATWRSILMLHTSATGGLFYGHSHEWKNTSEMLRVLDEATAKYQCRRLTIPFEDCRAKFANGLEWWLTPAEALAVGMIDSAHW